MVIGPLLKPLRLVPGIKVLVTVHKVLQIILLLLVQVKRKQRLFARFAPLEYRRFMHLELRTTVE